MAETTVKFPAVHTTVNIERFQRRASFALADAHHATKWAGLHEVWRFFCFAQSHEFPAKQLTQGQNKQGPAAS
jgi:hypothetical protein